MYSVWLPQVLLVLEEASAVIRTTINLVGQARVKVSFITFWYREKVCQIPCIQYVKAISRGLNG